MKETCLISLKKGMTMVGLRIIRITSLLLALAGLYQFAPQAAAFADGAESGSKALPADVQAIVSHVDDLDLLVALSPVKLTLDQIDKFLAILEPISKSDDDLTKQECDSIRAIAPDVEKARADSLKGTAPDPDATAKINKILADFNSKNNAAHKEAIAKVVDAAKSALTTDQFKTIQHRYALWCGGSITVPGELREDAAKRTQYIQDASLTEFANRIFLVQRTIPLLKALKNPSVATAGTTSGSNDKSNPTSSTAPAAP